MACYDNFQNLMIVGILVIFLFEFEYTIYNNFIWTKTFHLIYITRHISGTMEIFYIFVHQGRSSKYKNILDINLKSRLNLAEFNLWDVSN